ncbi:hypothetical protein [Lederbergia citri]|nr:hypothetical protein [Lederbergia citri]
MIRNYNFLISGKLISVTAASVAEASQKAKDMYMEMKQEEKQ